MQFIFCFRFEHINFLYIQWERWGIRKWHTQYLKATICRTETKLSCDMFQISVGLAFVSWFLLAISSYVMFLLAASAWLLCHSLPQPHDSAIFLLVNIILTQLIENSSSLFLCQWLASWFLFGAWWSFALESGSLHFSIEWVETGGLTYWINLDELEIWSSWSGSFPQQRCFSPNFKWIQHVLVFAVHTEAMHICRR